MTHELDDSDDPVDVPGVRLQLKPNRLRPAMLVMACKLVRPRDGVVLATPCQIPFKVSRLVVDPLVAPHFALVDVRVGLESQFVGYASDGVSMACFPPDPADLPRVRSVAEYLFLQGDPQVHQLAEGTEPRKLVNLPLSAAMPGQLLGLTVYNNDDLPHPFSCILYGEGVF